MNDCVGSEDSTDVLGRSRVRSRGSGTSLLVEVDRVRGMNRKLELFDPLKDRSSQLHCVVAIYSAWMNRPCIGNKLADHSAAQVVLAFNLAGLGRQRRPRAEHN